MTSSQLVPEVTVLELKQRLDKGTAPVILDVREPHELSIAALPRTAKSVHIPLGQLQARVDELKPFQQEEIVVYCRSGGRSLTAASFLIQNGYTAAKNLTGGILAWAQQVDPQVQQY